ncbi:MAG TPA: hypothetical protein VGD63_10640 [Steroidobacteraceae bacterium]
MPAVVPTKSGRPWGGREHELEQSIDIEHERFWSAFRAGDADNSGVLVGEVSGLIHDSPSAAHIVENMIAQACVLLGPIPRTLCARRAR